MINRRIGGPNAITWPSFWAAVVVSVGGNLPDRYSDQSGMNLPLNALAAILAVVVMFAVMLALKPLLLRDADVTPRPGRAIAIFIVGGAARGLALGLLLGAMGTGEPRLAFRIIASVIAIPLVMAFTATVVDVARTGAARRRRLRAEAEQHRSAEDEALAKALDIQERATAQVRTLLLDRLAALQDGRVDDLAPGLRADAEQVIRPMSHQMAALPPLPPQAPRELDVGRIRWSDVWQAASLGQPFRPLWVAVLLMVMSLSMLSAYNDSAIRGIGYAAAGGVLIALVLAVLGRVVAPRLRQMGATARTTAFIAAAVGGMVVASVGWALVMQALGSTQAWRSPFALMIVGPVVVVAFAIEQGFRQQVKSADAELLATNARLQYAAAVAGAAAWHEERRVSRALHGPVQTAVRAAAMRIDSGDLTGAEQLLVDALGHLEPGTGDVHVSDALAGIAKAWQGMCDVQVDVPTGVAGEIDHNPALASSVIDICTDACSNAVRHGQARRVRIGAVADRDLVDLVVMDDGAPGDGTQATGLGTAMLDDIAVTWDRRREGDRTVLRASLPLAAR